MNTQEQEDFINGLKAHTKELRTQRDLFIRAQSMHEQAEKLRQEAAKSRTDLDVAKKSLAVLQNRKVTAIQGTMTRLVEQINALLPSGEAVIDIRDDGEVFIGYVAEEGRQPVTYHALSGGEKVNFDVALCGALGANILAVEAAELDDTRLAASLRRYAETDLQVIVSTCRRLTDSDCNVLAEEGWKVEAVQL